jgi:5'-3' exoribonuclease 1
MGIKHFFQWFLNNHSECITIVPASDGIYNNVSIDTLALDLNGIFHPSAQKIFKYGKYPPLKPLLNIKRKYNIKNLQLKTFQEVGNMIDDLVNKVRPKKNLILCVDGVSGCAKMCQQRQRRFKSAKESEHSNCIFDSNSITPGTEFMHYLNKYIDWYIRVHLQNKDPLWKDLNIIFSSEKVPGEGEAKIFSYMRKHFPNPNESFCIYGLDADLIMLSLSLNRPNVYVYRDNAFKDNERYIINIELFASRLKNELKTKSAVTDFVFMCFMVGNDFLPQIPGLEIFNGGIEKLLTIYKTICNLPFKHTGLIDINPVKGGFNIKLDALLDYCKELSILELDALKEKYRRLNLYLYDPLMEKHFKLIYKDKDTNGNLYKRVFDWSIEKNSERYLDIYSTINSNVPNMHTTNKKENILNKPEYISKEGYPLFEDDPLNNVYFTKEITTFTKIRDDIGEVICDFPAYKQEYYEKKLYFIFSPLQKKETNFDNESEYINTICNEYIKGLQWVIHYYCVGIPSWDWFFPYNYAPFLDDLKNCTNYKFKPYPITQPSDPFQQLLAVLPPQSKLLIPKDLGNIMTDKISPLFKYYPDDFEIDVEGKRAEWEAIPILPILDFKLLKATYSKVIKNITEYDSRRNIKQYPIMYYISDNISSIIFKSYYGNIDNCLVHSRKVFI